MEIRVEERDGGNLLINAKFAGVLEANGIDSAVKLWGLSGEPVKKVLKERGTERVFLESPVKAGAEEMYLKRFSRTPVKEIIKNLSSLKPVRFSGALHEWNSIIAFHRHGIPTVEPVAAGKIGGGSCILTLGIKDYRRASDIFAGPPSLEKTRRRALVEKVAELAASMHSAGFAHQDFYLVHIFVKEDEGDSIFLIDLQRAIHGGKSLSERWRIKDLAQLLFSAEEHVSDGDLAHFWKAYCEKSFPVSLRNRLLLRKIHAKAARIRAHNRKRRP